ncbi:FAD-dependent oxidoreductase, partial [Candidatus Bipolaricaulota bacterium]|nr:FAD-dependent oxidoreductase [Candidatus Bipolaricaulota bacterium]
TGFLENTLELNEDGGIAVDEYLQAEEDIYAAGDVASFPYWGSGEEVRVEHWRLAHQQGRLAGKNMTGSMEKYRSVPLFWTNQFDIYLRYIGYADSWDEVIFDGDISEKRFTGYFVEDGQVLAAAGVNVNQKMAALSELMIEDELPEPEEVRSDGFDPVDKLRELG